MNKRYSAIRASRIASLALAFALGAPLGVAWGQPDNHQHDSHDGGSGHQGTPPPHGGAQVPQGAGAPHSGGGVSNGNGAAGHFSLAPRRHAPERPGNAPTQHFQAAPQLAPPRASAGPGFQGPRGDSNARGNIGRGGESDAHGHANGFAAGPARARDDSEHLANGARDAGHGERGFASNHDRRGGFDVGREHDRGLAFGRPGARHYDRDHWENHRHWNGGNWNGRYWPAIHDRPNFVWLLPTLPVGYVTYTWDGTPYYYYNDAYYTWDPGYAGYVATEPPPVADSGPAPDEAQPETQADAGGVEQDAPLYAYPTHGQSREQQAQDRQDCQQWASSQSPASDDDYQHALKACLTGRGYSVQ